MRDERADLVVVGGGSAGLTSAIMAAHLGAQVVLVERARLGGDCLWSGCVPSKSLLAAARSVSDARRAQTLGVASDGSVDFARVMARVRGAQDEIAVHDSPDTLRAQGVTVLHGHARFVAPGRLGVGDRVLAPRAILLATGAHPSRPAIAGIDSPRVVDHESIWRVDELPRRLAVLGGGPIGVELGQAFARLGAQVTIVERADRILPSFSAEAAAIVASAFAREGIDVRTRREAVAIEHDVNESRVVLGTGADAERIGADLVLVALGRRPSTDGLHLEVGGVRTEAGAIAVDTALRTSAQRVFAAGDCAGAPQSTHWAEHEARVATRNALYLGAEHVDRRRAPRVVFTDPEVAELGPLGPPQRPLERFEWPMSRLDRAICDGRTEGLVALTVDERERIHHAVAVGHLAAELVPGWTFAVDRGLGVRDLGNALHAYPTYTRANRRVADAMAIAHGAPSWARWFQRFSRRRGVAPVSRRARADLPQLAPALRTAVPTALVVGTLLLAIHHGEALAGGAVPPRWWLDYLVPLCVASWSGLRASRR